MLSCTMIVWGASAWMEAYHDRMPVLLGPPDFTGWLDGTLGAEALGPAPAATLRKWPVPKWTTATSVGQPCPAPANHRGACIGAADGQGEVAK
ncbi:SOS response-associated peptidase family protein [Falsiroseomonas sp. E2-1-a20]|uniref:SOS response-associated peptidase family protein n=1 Tax=Falsiroseomonas sp. E2-1-a20 TaxID=3239300 RepID=UPI003F36E254